MNILAVGAHPDDIEFGCAPVLIQEIANGNCARLLVLSRGEAGTAGTPEIREQESRDAAALMGAEIEFLDFGGDCHIEYRPENSIRIAREIRSWRPSIVLAPNPADNQHPDHSVAGHIVRDACRLARYGGLAELKMLATHKIGSLFYYNITGHVGHKPDVIVDVTDAAEKWEAAMRCHATQVASKGYLDLQMTAARLLGLASGVGYAIGLYANDPVVVGDLTGLQRSSREY
jgi:N-acetylglucosamine malate deacetylase 1